MVQVELEIPSVQERVEAVLPRLQSWAWMQVGNSDERDEAVQQTALKLLETEYEWKCWESWVKFCRRVLYNVIAQMRGRGRRKEMLYNSFEPNTRMERNSLDFVEITEWSIFSTGEVQEPDPFWDAGVERVINKTPQHAMAVWLYAQGFEPHEIAEQMQIAHSTVNAKLAEIRNDLRAFLGMQEKKSFKGDIDLIVKRLDSGANIWNIAAEYGVKWASAQAMVVAYRREIRKNNKDYVSASDKRRERIKMREQDIYRMVQEGKPNSEIARHFNVSVQTVYNVIKRLEKSK